MKKITKRLNRLNLNEKWRTYWLQRAEGKKHLEAAVTAGFSRAYASSAMYRTIQVNTRHQKAFDLILEAHGVDDNTIAKALQDGLNAVKTVTYKGRLIAEVPDFHTRLRSIEILMILKGFKFKEGKTDKREVLSEVFVQRLLKRSESIDTNSGKDEFEIVET